MDNYNWNLHEIEKIKTEYNNASNGNMGYAPILRGCGDVICNHKKKSSITEKTAFSKIKETSSPL